MEKSLEKLQEVIGTTQAWELTVDNFINESTKMNTLGSDIVSTQEFRSDLEKKMQNVISVFIKKHVKELLGCKNVVDSQENSIETLRIEIACLREENEQLNEMSLSLIKEIKGLKKYINESDILVSVLKGEMCKQKLQNKLMVDALKLIYEGNEESAAEILTKAFSLNQSNSENDEESNLTKSAIDIKQRSLENSFANSEDEFGRNFVNDRACQSAKLKVMLKEMSVEESISSVDERNDLVESVNSETAEGNADLEVIKEEETNSKTVSQNEIMNEQKDCLKVEQEVCIENLQTVNKKIEDTVKKSPEVKKQVLSKWLIPNKKKPTVQCIESHDEIVTNPIADTVEDKVEIFVEKARKEAIGNTKIPLGTLANLPVVGMKELLRRIMRKN